MNEQGNAHRKEELAARLQRGEKLEVEEILALMDALIAQGRGAGEEKR